MENFLWQKTLLDMYHTFDRIVIMMDNKFNQLLTNSMYNNNTTLLYEEMMYFMARKNNCVLAKSIVDIALDNLSKTNFCVLNFYYKDKLSFKEIAEKEQINLRQVFRNYDKELAKFSFYLAKQGFDTNTIKQEFGGDSLFLSKYNRLEQKVNNKAQISMKLSDRYVDDNCKNYSPEHNIVKDDYIGLAVVCD